jgi:multiple sugar transport system permease protein
MAELPREKPVPALQVGGRIAWSNQSLLGYVFVAPLMLWLAATILYPLIVAVQLSVQDVRFVGTEGNFVGLQNYERILTSPRFWNAMGRSLLWVGLNAFVQTMLAFFTALVLKSRFPGRNMARTWIILSWIVPTVVVVIIWRWLLSASGGIINYLLVSSGIISQPVGFFATSDAAFFSVVLINSWRWFPFIAVILLAALQRIPEELYEAAAVDGASALQRFFRITLPSLQPVLFVLGLIGTLLSFNVFDIIFLLTGGGPASATTTMPLLIYDTAFKGYRLSQAAAMSVVTGIILLVLALIFIRVAAPPIDEEGRI